MIFTVQKQDVILQNNSFISRIIVPILKFVVLMFWIENCLRKNLA